MLYSAICLDNSNYFEKGTVSVRIFKYYNVPKTYFEKDPNGGVGKIIETGISDLSKNDEEENFPDDAQDFEALIFSPLGGGRNYGMFMLPKTNEKGIIAFLDGAFSKPIWLGSYFSEIHKEDDYSVITGINIPNEDPTLEGIDSDGIKDGAINTSLEDSDNLLGDQNTIILRTKTVSKDSDGAKMDWENSDEIHTENLVAVDAKKVRVRHNSEWDSSTLNKYQEILIYKDKDNDDKETVQIDINNTKDSKRTYVKLTDETISFSLNDGSKTSIFELGTASTELDLDHEGFYLKDKNDNTVIGDGQGLMVNGDEESLVLYSNLKDILELLETHIHIGSVPTTEPLDSSLAPIKPQMATAKTNMEANKIKSKHH